MGGRSGGHTTVFGKIRRAARLCALPLAAALFFLSSGESAHTSSQERKPSSNQGSNSPGQERETSSQEPSPSNQGRSPSRPWEGSRPFQTGESLKYQIRWLSLAVATLRLSVEGPLKWEGNNVFRFRSRLKSAGLLRHLIRVDDRVTSYTDAAGLFSRRIEIRQREGHYRGERWNVFEGRRATYGRPKRPPRFYEIPGPVQDFLGALYKTRAFDLQPGKRMTLEIFNNKKLHPVRINVIGTETSDTLWGPVRTLVLRPEFVGNNYLKSFGTTWIYVTADRHRIPVRFESRTYLGTAVAHLVESRGVLSGPLSRTPIRKLKGWKSPAKRVKESADGGLIKLKEIMNKSHKKYYKKKYKHSDKGDGP